MKSNVKLISGLKDWNKVDKRLLPKGIRAAANLNGVIPDELGLYLDDKENYHTSGYVGVVWLKDRTGTIVRDQLTGKKMALMVSPRFNLNPWEMLIKVMNDPEYELYTEGNSEKLFKIFTKEDFIPVEGEDTSGELLAAISFIKECERLCKRNLRSSMSFKHSNFNGRIVGNIDFPKHIKNNIAHAREDRVYCRYPVFTVDTLENRILKSTLERVRKVFRSKGITISSLGSIYRYSVNALKDVKYISIKKSDFSRVNVTGFNSQYKIAIELAKSLFNKKYVAALGTNNESTVKFIMPYTINMESLFEFYTRALLKDYLKNNSTDFILDEYRRPDSNPLTTLKDGDNEAYLMEKYIPDIALLSKKGDSYQYEGVFDVKYQNSIKMVNSDTRRHNSHQLMFYTLLLNVKKSGFIFPGNGINNNFKRYEINIQEGNIGCSSAREFSQIYIDSVNDKSGAFAKDIIGFLKR